MYEGLDDSLDPEREDITLYDRCERERFHRRVAERCGPYVGLLVEDIIQHASGLVNAHRRYLQHLSPHLMTYDLIDVIRDGRELRKDPSLIFFDAGRPQREEFFCSAVAMKRVLAELQKFHVPVSNTELVGSRRKIRLVGITLGGLGL